MKSPMTWFLGATVIKTLYNTSIFIFFFFCHTSNFIVKEWQQSHDASSCWTLITVKIYSIWSGSSLLSVFQHHFQAQYAQYVHRKVPYAMVFQLAVPFKEVSPLHFPPQHNEPQNLHWRSQWTTFPTPYQLFFNYTSQSTKLFCMLLLKQTSGLFIFGGMSTECSWSEVEKYD